MALYLLTIDPYSTGQRSENVMLVSANSEADARAMAESLHGDTWTGAHVTAQTFSDVTVADANALVGWRFKIKVVDPSTMATVADVEVVGDATDDTLDEIGTALATALNGTPSIAAAAYTAASQTLTVAAGASDALGDHIVEAYVFPPQILTADGHDQLNHDVSIPGFISSVTDEGLSSADLTVVYGADTLVVPDIKKSLLGV